MPLFIDNIDSSTFSCPDRSFEVSQYNLRPMTNFLINESVQHLLRDPAKTVAFERPKVLNTDPLYGFLGDPQWRYHWHTAVQTTVHRSTRKPFPTIFMSTIDGRTVVPFREKKEQIVLMTVSSAQQMVDAASL